MTPARTVHVEHCMGTVFSIDVRDPGQWQPAIAEVVEWLHSVDAVFSTYRADSDVSRLRRGELRLGDAHPSVADVLDLCAQAQADTHGYFTALPDGRIDPTGLVKGWAACEASRLLRRRGSANHAVNGGGDVQLAGEAEPGRPWTVGIVDPRERTRVLTTVAGRDFAVASSGVGERGLHVLDPFTGVPATGAVGTTVVGPSLTFADAYATAALVMGPDAVRWIDAERPGYAVLVVDADGTEVRSRRWPRVDLPPSLTPARSRR
ncbi:MAG TPA: FAD:protein FMN transferase [Jatrophihabitans sp.]|nr:FAD:protein FMN transferase [Jatrophihabitans sp.]